MAEALFRKDIEVSSGISASSAGISAADGAPPSDHAVDVLRDEGIDISGLRSSSLMRGLVDKASYIFAMTRAHKEAIEHLYPSAAEKTFLVCEFCDPAEIVSIDVPDPIGLGRDAYAATRDQLKKAMPGIHRFIRQTTNSMSDKSESAATLTDSPPRSHPLPTVVIGADHGGFKLKESLIQYLRGKGHDVEDLGTHSSESVDYPDLAHAVCRDVADRGHDFGILVCTTGIGMSITANRYQDIRASLVTDAETARLTRRHNDSNVLCLGGSGVSEEDARKIADAYLETSFEGGRHERRLLKVDPGGSPALESVDPQVSAAIQAELARQRDHIELIASENFASAAVREAQGSVLTNKYAEGYPRKRWYGGCENVDTVEQLAIDRACKLFGAQFANVQPHSGSQANAAVYFAFLEHGDIILTMDLAHGGHLTHGHPKNFSGMFYKVVHYGVSKENEHIDYDQIQKLAQESKPKMITAGASAYSRIIDFPRLRQIADSVNALLFVDMAHIAGLVAAGVHPSPIPHAHFVTSTTHKSLRGPRGGVILTNDEEYAKKIDSMVFPGSQGGPLEHVIAAKAVCFLEDLQPEFKEYAAQIVRNSQALASALTARGYRIVSGGTDNHLFMVDVRPQDLNGKEAQEALDKAGITINKNAIPFDTLSPFKAGGIRIGTPAVTSRGMKEPEMESIAALIDEALTHRTDDRRLAAIQQQVVDLNRGFPLP